MPAGHAICQFDSYPKDEVHVKIYMVMAEG